MSPMRAFWGWWCLVTGLGFAAFYTRLYWPMAIGLVGMLGLVVALLYVSKSAWAATHPHRQTALLYGLGAVASVPVWNPLYLELVINTIPVTFGILTLGFVAGFIAAKRTLRKTS